MQSVLAVGKNSVTVVSRIRAKNTGAIFTDGRKRHCDISL